MVDLRTREQGASTPISDRREVVAKADMPRTVTLHGAQVELQSLDNGALTYRVIGGFATDRPLTFLGAPRR